jgi:hypothetical protein
MYLNLKYSGHFRGGKPPTVFTTNSANEYEPICSREYSRGIITVPLTSCLTGLDLSVWQINTKIVSCHSADSKPAKQEVNSTVVLPPLVFPDGSIDCTDRDD